MKKIITAMGDKYLNEKLKKEKFKVLGKDVQYIDGIFEQLEVEKDVNIIIISTKLIKENKYKELVYKINLVNKKIKIIFIIENKNNKLIKFLNEKNIKYFFHLNNNNIKYLIKYLKIKNINLNNKVRNKKYRKKGKSDGKLITITGIGGVGKTIFTRFFAKILKEKILIIDFDKSNSGLYTLYNVNKNTIKLKNKQENIIKNNIKNINQYIDLLTIINLKRIKNIINYNKNKYKYILIDVSVYIKNNYLKQLFQNSDDIIFITEGNLLQLKKSKKLLEFYLNYWNIKKERIYLLINKKNKNTISLEIIKNIFIDLKTLGEIKYDNNYDSLINNNYKNMMLNHKIIKQYKRVVNNYKNLKTKEVKNWKF